MGENKSSSADRHAIKVYLVDMSTKARSVGRNVVFSVIAASWTICYTNNVFKPSLEIKLSLGLALVYLFLDLLYYIIMTTVYKYMLVRYFKSEDDGGYGYAGNIDIEGRTKWWMKFGFIWLLVMSAILLTSSILLIIHVFKIQV